MAQSDPKRQATMNLRTTETFSETFGPKRQRKRVKLAAPDVEALATDVERRQQVSMLCLCVSVVVVSLLLCLNFLLKICSFMFS